MTIRSVFVAFYAMKLRNFVAFMHNMTLYMYYMYLEFTLLSDYLVKKYEKFILWYKNCSNLHWYFGITMI